MTSDEPAFRTLSLTAEETVPTEGGRLQWVPVRRRLGISAFGTNAFRASRAGDLVVEDHVESPGQEELYVVVSGRARFSIDEEETEAPAGTAVFVPKPDARRSAIALEDGTIVLAVGGWPGRPYHSLPWEPIYMAQEPMRQGDWARAAEVLEREAGEHLDTAIVQFRLACCHAQLGDTELALQELQRAMELNPSIRERVITEDLLTPLRGLDGWPAV